MSLFSDLHVLSDNLDRLPTAGASLAAAVAAKELADRAFRQRLFDLLKDQDDRIKWLEERVSR